MDTEILDRITVHPDEFAGKPCVRGMRIRVTDVLDLHAAGSTPAEIVRDLAILEPEDVIACLRFASQQADRPVRAA